MQPSIYVLGDIHGDFKPIRAFVQRNKTQLEGRNNILILLGDAGLNFFFNHRDEELKKKLSKYPLTYFVIRGNHEQRPSICANEHPQDWHTEIFFDNTVYVENNYPNIKYAMDSVCVYNIPSAVNNYYTTLIIPGAYSVDKQRRLEAGWSWFPREQLSEQEMQNGLDLVNDFNHRFDLVLSHTCPVIYEPTDLFLSIIDQSTVDKTMERYLGQIEKDLDYKLWLFGHYHSTRIYPEFEGKQTILLYNNQAIKLDEWMSNEERLWY